MPPNFSSTANEIWAVADLLRGDFKQSQYGRIILPFALLRRLECVLAPTKAAVLKKLPAVVSMPADAPEKLLLREAKQQFYNTSPPRWSSSRMTNCSSSAGGAALGPPPLARQEAGLREWADRLGLLLNPAAINSRLTRGGQEHDIYHEGGRVIKVTRHGVFGFSPGIELALVASSQDARRFHLWDASPLEYLERLHLQNFLVPGLNTLEGVIVQPGDEMSIVTSQPRFEIIPVTTAEIDAWFASFGFGKITDSAYYRPDENLGIFDAHDKNVVRAGDILIPFDVIPCHPAGGFLAFIQETLAAGHSLRAVRNVSTARS